MQTTVADVMTPEPVVVEVWAPLDEAMALMEEHSVRRLPVIDEEGLLVGVLSWGDVREASSLEGATTNPYAPEADEDWLTVWEAMTKDPIVVTPQTSLPDAVELLLAHKIGGLPVVEAEAGPGRRQLVGVVSRSDILKLLLGMWRAQENALE